MRPGAPLCSMQRGKDAQVLRRHDVGPRAQVLADLDPEAGESDDVPAEHRSVALMHRVPHRLQLLVLVILSQAKRRTQRLVLALGALDVHEQSRGKPVDLTAAHQL